MSDSPSTDPTPSLDPDEINSDEIGTDDIGDNIDDDIGTDIDSDSLDAYCAQFGLSPETLAVRVATPADPGRSALPAWTDTLEAVWNGLTPATPVATTTDGDGTPVPFGRLLGRVVTVARRRRRDHVDTTADGRNDVGSAARDDLEAALCGRLANLAAKALHADFLAFVAAETGRDDPTAVCDPDETAFRNAHRAAFLRDRKTTFLERYPVLARQLATLVDDWVTATAAFERRLADAPLSTVSDGRVVTDPARGVGVTDSDGGATVVGVDRRGDPHAGGRRVAVCRLADGRRVVYKPRATTPEAALAGVCRWLSRSLPGHPSLPAVSTVARDGHGWVSHVSPETPGDRAAYARAAGALVSVVRLLCGVDAHAGNVVATAAGPVLVDAETLCHPPTADRPDDPPAAATAHDAVSDSVLFSQLLPFRVGDHAATRAGLRRDTTTGGRETVTWRNPETDAVRAVYTPSGSPTRSNVPPVSGDGGTLTLPVDALCAGFERSHAALCRRRERVAAELRARLTGVTVRRLLADTGRYTATLGTLSNPPFLRSGTRFACKAVAALSPTGSRPSAVVRAELRALMRRDVPRFVVDADGDAVRTPAGETVTRIDGPTGVDRVCARLAALSPTDRRRQSRLLRAAVVGTDLGVSDPHGGRYG